MIKVLDSKKKGFASYFESIIEKRKKKTSNLFNIVAS